MLNNKRAQLKEMHRNLLQAVYNKEETVMNLDKVNKEMNWKDISNESYRTYLYPSKIDSSFPRPLVEVTIEKPELLSVNFKSGGHKIIDTFGMSWYIPEGWVALKWEGWEYGIPTYQF